MSPPLVIFTTPFISGSTPPPPDFNFDGSYFHDPDASAAAVVTRYSNTTTPSDSLTSTISFWYQYYKHTDTILSFAYVFSCDGGRVLVRALPAGQISVRMFNAATVLIQDQNSDANISHQTDEEWHHFLYSRTGASTNLYIDDVLQVGTHPTNLGGSASWSGGTFDIPATSANTFPWKGCLSKVYLNSQEYINFAVEANRRLFIDSNGDPVDLGPAGATPTGTAPSVYLDEGNPLNNTGTLGGSFPRVSGASVLECCTLDSPYVAVVLADSPEAYWIMNETSASNVATIADSSGNGKTATVSGSTHRWGLKPGPSFGLSDDYHGQANDNAPQIFRTDAAWDNVIGAPGQEYTFECWMRSSNSLTQGGLLEKTDGVNNWNSLAIVASTQTARFQILDGGTNPFVDASVDVTDTDWHHVVGMRTTNAGSYGEESIKIYIDGGLQESLFAASSLDSTNTTNFLLGDRASGTGASNYVGDMSHAAVYFTALNASQVLEHFNTMTT